MQPTKSEQVRLGIFLILGGLLILGIGAFFVGRQMLVHKTPYYTRFFESVNGLNPGAKVRWNGVAVGEVTEVDVDSTSLNAVLVHFELVQGTQMKASVRANLVGGLSLTGLKTIELTGGTNAEPTLPPQSFIPAGTSQLKQITGQAESIIVKSETLLNNLITITSDENQANITSALRSFSHSAQIIDSSVSHNRGNLDSIPKQLHLALSQSVQTLAVASQTMESLQKETSGLRLSNRLDSIDHNLNSAIKALQAKIDGTDLNKTLGSFEAAANQVETVAKRADVSVYRNQEDLLAVMKNMKEASANLADFTRQIRQNPSLLMRSEDKQGRTR